MSGWSLWDSITQQALDIYCESEFREDLLALNTFIQPVTHVKSSSQDHQFMNTGSDAGVTSITGNNVRA